MKNFFAVVLGACMALLMLAGVVQAVSVFIQPGTTVGGQYNLVAPTLSDGQVAVMQLDASGNQKVSGTMINGAGTASIGNTGQLAIPITATPTAASSGNVANATATATIAATAAKTNYITGIQITYGGATAGQCVVATVTGTTATAPSFVVCSPTGPTVAGTPVVIEFPSPIQATGTNVAVSVSLPALGAGNTNTVVNVQGYVM